MNDRAFLAFVRILPKHALSRVVGSSTRARIPAAVHQAAIRIFCRRYGVAVEEAERPLEAYRTLGEFFTRRLKAGLRPIDPGGDIPVSPVDGAVSFAGQASEGRLIQCKGRDYTLEALLADPEEARAFSGGSYATLYLSPRDYHRIHAPLGGAISGYSYVPGQLWPVNQASVRGVPELFAVNERLITYLETPVGRVAVIAVGATCVGRIRVFFDEVVTNAGRSPIRVRYATGRPVEKGAELGMFEMGSTVILLFEPGRVSLDEWLVAGAAVRQGRRIGAGRSAT